MEGRARGRAGLRKGDGSDRVSILSRWLSSDTGSTPPVDFTLPDDEGRPFTFDSEFRDRRNSVLVWYRGHW